PGGTLRVLAALCLLAGTGCGTRPAPTPPLGDAVRRAALKGSQLPLVNYSRRSTVQTVRIVRGQRDGLDGLDGPTAGFLDDPNEPPPPGIWPPLKFDLQSDGSKIGRDASEYSG